MSFDLKKPFKNVYSLPLKQCCSPTAFCCIISKAKSAQSFPLSTRIFEAVSTSSQRWINSCSSIASDYMVCQTDERRTRVCYEFTNIVKIWHNNLQNNKLTETPTENVNTNPSNIIYKSTHYKKKTKQF